MEGVFLLKGFLNFFKAGRGGGGGNVKNNSKISKGRKSIFYHAFSRFIFKRNCKFIMVNLSFQKNCKFIISKKL